MSIVNISSENKPSGYTDADFTIQIKKTLQKVIGMQLLNATVPLSYNIINQQNYRLIFTITGHSDNARNGEHQANLNFGTYSPQEFAKELTDKMNYAAQFFIPIKNQNFYDFCVENRSLSFLVNDSPYSKVYDTHPTSILQVSNENDLTGFQINNGTGTIHHIQEYNTTTGVAATSDGNQTVNTTTTIQYQGICVIYDEVESCFVIGINSGLVSINPSNSRRMLKTIGFTGQEEAVQVGAFASHYKYKLFGNSSITGNQTPELSGPSLIFLRIGGDVLLDQQNSETHMNDRIPIPITVSHGGVMHFENDSESDVIPFSVPCDVSRIKFRLEYGDDNEIVGGSSDNFRGHHTYFRLKFYKQHQQSGKKL